MAKAPAPAATRGISPKDIWDALLKAGASSVQAAGVMGNMISESSLNVESAAMDSNGAMAYGLVSWNAASYPNASGLVTGNPAADLKAQINFLASSGGFRAASGTTVRETAGNFAANYERCQGCQSGGSQWTTRVAQALQVAGWAASGSWPASKGQASTSATLTAAQQAEQTKGQKSCAWAVGWGGIPGTSWLSYLNPVDDITGSHGNALGGEICILSKSQARALIGVMMLSAGSFTMLFGITQAAAAAGLTAPQILRAMGREAKGSPGGGGGGFFGGGGGRGGGGGGPSGGGGTAAEAGEGAAAADAGEAAAGVAVLA